MCVHVKFIRGGWNFLTLTLKVNLSGFSTELFNNFSLFKFDFEIMQLTALDGSSSSVFWDHWRLDRMRLCCLRRLRHYFYSNLQGIHLLDVRLVITSSVRTAPSRTPLRAIQLLGVALSYSTELKVSVEANSSRLWMRVENHFRRNFSLTNNMSIKHELTVELHLYNYEQVISEEQRHLDMKYFLVNQTFAYLFYI